MVLYRLLHYMLLKLRKLSKKCMRGLSPHSFNWLNNYRIRGRLGSVAQVSRNSGMLTAFILGALLDYHLLPFIFIIIPIAYLMKFLLLPNTPQHLVKRGKFEVTLKIIANSYTVDQM